MADNDEPTETPEQGAGTGSAAGSGDTSAAAEPAEGGGEVQPAEGGQEAARAAGGADAAQSDAEAGQAGPAADEPAAAGEGGDTAQAGETAEAGQEDESGGEAAEAGEEDARPPAPRRTPSGDRPLCVGRRKTAVARARIEVGSGEYALNGRPLEEYFPTEKLRAVVTRPFSVIEQEGRWDVSARLHGGGLTGQAGALQLALARALAAEDPEWRSPLKHAGMLRRDARKVERKKYGRKKARKSPQYSKR